MFGGDVGEPYDVNYHQPGDLTNNCNVGAWITNTKAIADIIAKYGRTTDGFPERKLIKKVKRGDWSHGTHGHNHDHSEGGCGDGLY